MQNEELRNTQQQLEESRDRYIDLYDFAPVGYLTLDDKGLIAQANLACASLLGVDRIRLSHRRFDSFVSPQDRDSWHRHLLHVSTCEEAQTIELALNRHDGACIHARLECVRLPKPESGPWVRIALTDITKRHQAYQALQESEELLRGSQLIAGLGSYVLDIPNGRWESTPFLDALFGIDETYDRTVEGWIALIHQNDRTMMQNYFVNDVLGKGSIFDREYRIIRQTDGAIRWVHGYGKVMLDAHGTAEKMLGTIQDVTEYKVTDEKIRIAATAFESQEGMVITDVAGTILQVNKAYCAITGYTEAEVVGKNPRMMQSGRQNADFYKQMWSTILHTGFWEGEIWNSRKNGEVYPEHLIITAVKNEAGKTTHYVGTLTDITLNREAADEIKHLAYYDLLTRLPNRRLLHDRLKHALTASTRSGRHGALLFIDLDDFKTLNDTLGHDIGDMLLEQVGQRLESCVREGDTVARLGGDEFVVMLEELSENSIEAAVQSEAIANKILSLLNQPYLLAHHECHSTPSIGAILFMGHRQGSEELLKHADIAMYQAKKDGRNRLCFFDKSMQEAVTVRAALEADLRRALDRHQFQLYYQIQTDGSSTPLGAEALIRWRHPKRGLVNPVDFIPLAEESGLIIPIGEWVLDTACAQLSLWQQNVLTRDLVISVNVSARQFRQTDFVAVLQSLLQHHAVKPNLLKLELTESMLLENVDDLIDTMHALKPLGVLFSLDDFGTGYSSLQYLKRLPLNQLKIDRSFVSDIATDSNDKAIVRTIIAMAHGLSLDVIAEGVETREQVELLLEYGCTDFQGYLFSRPVPIAEFEALIKQKRH
ncbi:MAG: EAL domain-containing protein [Gammaproteobacteria bacterium]|nr:EAL domain-containing protein [Gammaproteobacteria bacterium]MBU1625026.1 EAL domain-containing protein [Gammaproteobacteria bacterium]MBU1981286.1 EAL domain-containing protein [Gammaproteobacteria bacterium]